MADDRLVLSYDPWGGDDTDTQVLSDKMVVVRKDHQCAICFGPIAKGERVRSMTELNREDSVVATFRFCTLCCEAMAADDDGNSIYDRHAIGAIRSRSR